jgi:hypothetical protein
MPEEISKRTGLEKLKCRVRCRVQMYIGYRGELAHLEAGVAQQVAQFINPNGVCHLAARLRITAVGLARKHSGGEFLKLVGMVLGAGRDAQPAAPSEDIKELPQWPDFFGQPVQDRVQKDDVKTLPRK